MSAPGAAPLPERWQAALVLCFGAVTSLLVLFLADASLGSLDLLLLSASFGALATSGLWLWAVAARNSSRWGVALALALWVPYVNFVVASLFARRYWNQGARAPALLALAGIAVQVLVTLRTLAPSLTAPV